MAEISSDLSLHDGMTPIFSNIVMAIDNTLNSLFSLQGKFDGFDTSSFDVARISIDKAGLMLSSFDAGMKAVDVSTLETSESLEDASKNIGSVTSALDVFNNTVLSTMNTASTKFANFGEYASEAKDAIAELVDEQYRLFEASSGKLGNIDLSNMHEMSYSLTELKEKIESMPSLSIKTDGVAASIKEIENNLQNMKQTQITLNDALQNTNIRSVITEYEKLNSMITQTEEVLKGFNKIWQETSDFKMFTNTGLERFILEIESAKTSILELEAVQQEITSGFESLNIIPERELTKIQNMETRLFSIKNTIESIPALDMETEAANNAIEQIRQGLYNATSAQTALNKAIKAMDLTTAQKEYRNLNNIITQTEKYIRDNISTQMKFTDAIEESNIAANTLLGSMIGVYASFKSLKGAISLSDEYTQTTARLNLMNDGLYTTEELQNKIYKSAQNARSSYQTMADVVSKIGLRASDAFDSTDEIIQFSENISKMFVIAGASSQEIYSASLQLTQALGSGTLRGEELNAVLEAAPNIVEKIADYMGVAKGEIKTLASNGLVTSEIVRNAILVATEDINEQFESIPMTWSQVWTTTMNSLYNAFQPVLSAINTLAQYSEFIIPIIAAVTAAIAAQAIAVGVLKAKTAILNTVKAVLAVREAMAATGMGAFSAATVTATGAQWSYNAALYACPLTWIIIAIVAVIVVIYLAVAAWNKFTGDTVSGTGVIAGALAGLAALILDVFIFIYNVVAVVIDTIGNLVISVVEFLINCWNDFGGSFERLWYDCLDVVLNICEKIADIIDAIISPIVSFFGGSFDLSAKIAAKREEIAIKKAATITEDTVILDRWDHSADYVDFSDWAEAGYNWGANLFGSSGDDDDEIDWSSYLDSIDDSTDDIAETTESIDSTLKDGLEILEYMKDRAERAAIDRYSTRNITVQVTNNNNFNNKDNITGIVDAITRGVQKAIDVSVEGVYS